MERWQRYGVPFPRKKNDKQQHRQTWVWGGQDGGRWVTQRTAHKTFNLPKTSLGQDGFMKRKWQIDLPRTNISVSQMKVVEQHDYDWIWFIQVMQFGTRCLNINYRCLLIKALSNKRPCITVIIPQIGGVINHGKTTVTHSLSWFIAFIQRQKQF